MKTLGSGFVILLSCFLSVAAQDARPRFDDYKVSHYQGRVHVPKWIQRSSSGEWRDDAGKLVDPPEVNFAGKYYIGAHSCGTGCRYYTMTDLSSGRELKALFPFSTAEPLPKTHDGFEYLTTLHYQADSEMIIAQYLIDLGQRSECRERAFLFRNARIKPITKTRRTCSTFQ